MSTAASETTKRARMRALLRSYDSVVIGYSGGVDSVLVAAVAVEELGPARVLAVTGRSPSFARWMEETARAVATQRGIPWLEVDTEEIDDPRYAANAPDRCFFCKDELWRKLATVARQRGFRTIVDGTNADDDLNDRPGWRAGERWGVRSPLREAGLTKAEVRRWSRELGLPTWDAPASPCLASRIVHGVPVTRARLQQVEAAEGALRGLGWEEVRVRHHGDVLRLEVAPASVPAAATQWATLRPILRAAATECVVGLDPLGYRGLRGRGDAAAGRRALAAAGAELAVRGAMGEVLWLQVPRSAWSASVAAGPDLAAALCHEGVRFLALDVVED